MRNLMKKSLACCLAIALCLTAMVGITVSAAEVEANITVDTEIVESGAATADVIVTLGATKTSVAFIDVATDAGTVSAVTTTTENVTVDFNGNRIVADLSGVNTADSVVLNLTIALVADLAEGSYPVTVAIFTAADIDENLIVGSGEGAIVVKAPHVHAIGYTSNENGTHTTKCTADGCDAFLPETSDCTYVDGVCSACGYAEPVTGPVVDANLKVAGASIGFADSSLKITFRMASSVVDSYPNMELVFVPEKYDTATTNLIANPTEVVVPKSALATAGKNRTYVYTDIQLYELGLNIRYFLRATDANGKVFISEPVDMIPAESLKSTFATSSNNAKLRSLITDVLVVGDESAKYFAKADSDLANATSIIEGFDISEATVAPADYVANVIDNIVAANADFGTASTCTHKVAKSVAIGKAPYLNYRIYDKNKVLDLDKFSIKVTYDALNFAGEAKPYEKTFTNANSDKFARSGNNITFKFDEIGLGDSCQNIVIEISYDGSVVCTNTYAMEKYLTDTMNGTTKAVALTTALFNLGIGFRNMAD